MNESTKNREWMERMADAEAKGSVSVGGLYAQFGAIGPGLKKDIAISRLEKENELLRGAVTSLEKKIRALEKKLGQNEANVKGTAKGTGKAATVAKPARTAQRAAR